MTLQDFPGNAHIKAVVRGMLENDRLPHALIIEGERGLGRHALTDILASGAVCSGEKKPCGICRECQQAQKHTHPDITTVSPDGAVFKVDAVRKIRQEAYVLPNQAQRRVFVLDGAEKMNESAQNALLKVLEEPPAFTMFLLITESAGALLSTIRSRAVTLSLMPVDDDTARRFLQTHCPTASAEQLDSVLPFCDGNLGAALQMLRDGTTGSAQIDEILTACERGDELDLLLALQPLIAAKKRDAVEKTLRALLSRMQRLIADKAAGRAAAGRAGDRLTLKRLMQMAAAAEDAIARLPLNPNLGLLLTDLCACFKSDFDV